MNICCLYENQCIVDFGNGQRFFENSSNGREQLRSACDKNNACAVYDEVLTVWGANPTVEDEPELTFAELKAQKKAEIAASRYVVETGGIAVSGATIDTDRDSQALITGAALAAVIDNSYSLNWKTAQGFVHLTSHEIIAVAQAVRAHVQHCFDREGELVALVDAAQNEEELNAIEITWPV